MNSINTTANPTKINVIKVEYLTPKDCVSSDQFECRAKGYLSHTKSKEDQYIMQ